MALSICPCAAARPCVPCRGDSGLPRAAVLPSISQRQHRTGRELTLVRARDLGRTSDLSLKNQAKKEQVEIYDKLIAVFQSKKQSEWKKLIGFSKQWSSLADGVFKRCAPWTLRRQPTGQQRKAALKCAHSHGGHAQMFALCALSASTTRARPGELAVVREAS